MESFEGGAEARGGSTCKRTGEKGEGTHIEGEQEKTRGGKKEKSNKTG